MTSFAARAARYRVAVQRELRAVVGDARDGLSAWMRYHLGWENEHGAPVEASPGKMLRPVGLLLAAELAGGALEHAVPAAAAVELVHNFSLLHDDIEDSSDVRRGRPTVWAVAGTAHAINAGDAMFTLARLALHRLPATVPPARAMAAMRELDEACLSLVRGQYLDLSFEGRVDVAREEYLAMAEGKTAAMFAAAFAIGAVLGGTAPPVVDAYRAFGRHIGLAFQAVDDVLGIWGDPAVTGKPAGDDLRARKMTYPVITALADGGEAARVLRRAYEAPATDADDAPAIRALVDRTHARLVTETMAAAEEQQALDALRAAGVDEAALALCGEFAGEVVRREA